MRLSILTKTLISFCIIILFLLLAWCLVMYVCSKKNDLAEKQISKLIPLIEDFYLENERYPEQIDEIKLFNSIKKEKVIYLFPATTLEYRVMPNGFRLYYYEAPLGPFHGYDNSFKDWYNEE